MMRSIKLGIISLVFFIGGFWLFDLIGNPDASKNAVSFGRLLALVMGLFSAGAVHMIWGAAADQHDFMARVRRDAKRRKLR